MDRWKEYFKLLLEQNEIDRCNGIISKVRNAATPEAKAELEKLISL